MAGTDFIYRLPSYLYPPFFLPSHLSRLPAFKLFVANLSVAFLRIEVITTR